MLKPLLLLSALALTGGAALHAPSETTRGFPVHDAKSAPEATRAILEGYAADFGFVPNTAAVMGESPALVKSYAATQQNLREHSSLSSLEINLVQLTASVGNECSYCTAAHTMVGASMFKTPQEVLDAVRAGTPIPDPKLSALRDFAIAVQETHGKVSDEQLKAFYDAGYDRAQALDVVACLAVKTMSNFTNRLANTPLDEPLQSFAPGGRRDN